MRIYYPIDVVAFSEQGQKSLDSLTSLLKRNKQVTITITGYADYLGANPHNIDLSVERSALVKKYIASKGFDTLRILHCGGKGALKPPDHYDSPVGIPQHRKVDVAIQWTVPAKPAATQGKNPHKPPSVVPPPLSNLKTLKAGDQITLPNVYFEGGRHIFIPQSYPTLDELVKILKENPTLKIEIQGHICCDSVSADGIDYESGKMELSVTRAKAVYDYLVEMGIKANRLTYKGFGGKIRLIKDERTESDRRRNRRVEIKVLEK
ncbi:MAG: OmpA family protein [Bacteroidetes bacterium]|nr:OmpA family protein [Bacteroidota bacterium]